MAGLEISHASKAFDKDFAISDVSLSVEQGELACLLGPSGCGKSTLLRLIAGLEHLDSGTVAFDGVDLRGSEPHTRGFGLMFQDLALFPHMDVFGNIAFGLRMQGMDRVAIQRRVDELLTLVDLAGYGERKTDELSGGERQRVALARSLAPAPKLLMLDEPLSSLDRVLRESLQTQIRAILKQVGVTAVYVTHDREEAFAVADTIVVMDRGAIVQTGAPEVLFAAPANELVARSLGIRNMLPGVIAPGVGALTVSCALGAIGASGPAPTVANAGVLVLIDERGVQVGRRWDTLAGDGAVTLTGVISARSFRGSESELRIAIGDGELVCVVPSQQAANAVGDEVSVTIPREAVRLLPVTTPSA
jgi:ABC-type Fe3+/spermidine/putrescine transport system ATPase subunit